MAEIPYQPRLKLPDYVLTSLQRAAAEACRDLNAHIKWIILQHPDSRTSVDFVKIPISTPPRPPEEPHAPAGPPTPNVPPWLAGLDPEAVYRNLAAGITHRVADLPREVVEMLRRENKL